MNPEFIHDLVGIGIGPFNLGLAALCSDIPDLSCIFFDQSTEFNWHPGMMIADAKMQVPFYADLTTVIDPKSHFTFLNYLKEKGRMFRFANRECIMPYRREYNNYCKWTASQLSSLRFNSKVTSVDFDEASGLFRVHVLDLAKNETLSCLTRHIVLGIGTEPLVPSCVNGINHAFIFHSSEYLHRKKEILNLPSVSIIGSGQSAGEIYRDLLNYDSFENLSWFTKSERFYPMESTKLSYEMTSPDFINFFHSLEVGKKEQLLGKLDALYKGINASLINDIFDTLDLKFLAQEKLPFHIMTSTELKSVMVSGSEIEIQLHHCFLEESFTHKTSALILATGYKPRYPAFLKNVQERITWLKPNLFSVTKNYSVDVTGKQIFVQNAELHTHGFSAPDLGMGPYRNATILNTILGYEHFKLEKNTTFQNFGQYFKELKN